MAEEKNWQFELEEYIKQVFGNVLQQFDFGNKL